MSQLARWIFSLLSLSASCMAAQVVNFDDVPDGTDISTHYQGLKFSCAGTECASPKIFARQWQNAASPHNVVAPQQATTDPPFVQNHVSGTIQIDIACKATKVTVRARGFPLPEHFGGDQYAIIVAKDANGNYLGEADGTQYNQWELLTVSSASNTPIKTVFLGVEGNALSSQANFDDLTVDCATIGPIWRGKPLITYWVPIWLAFIVGIVVVIVIRQRRKRL